MVNVYLTRAMAPDKSCVFVSKSDNSALPLSVTYLSMILKQLISDRKLSSLQENHRCLVFPPACDFKVKAE